MMGYIKGNARVLQPDYAVIFRIVNIFIPIL